MQTPDYQPATTAEGIPATDADRRKLLKVTATGLGAAAAAGIRAVIQPGGSMRDEEVIAAADEAGMAMVFTGVRHFRH